MNKEAPKISFEVAGYAGSVKTIVQPDFQSLFSADRECSCGCEDAMSEVIDCENESFREPVLTPLNAALMYQCCDLLLDIFSSGASYGFLELKEKLPRICQSMDSGFYGSLLLTLNGFKQDISEGRVPVLDCTGAEMMMHIVLDEMELRIEESDIEIGVSAFVFNQITDYLCDSAEDFNIFRIRDLIFDDIDVIFLFDPAMDGIENSEEGVALGVSNLHPSLWFKKF